MSKPAKLTAEEARRLIHYDPETGALTWRVRKGSIPAGTICGSPHTNYNNGSRSVTYRVIGINYKDYTAHRVAWLIMTGRWPVGIDHDDGDGLNNRWNNLFEADHQQNQKNTKRRRDNTSGITGVTRCRQTSTWRAIIVCNGKSICLGRFKDIHDAISARKTADVKYGFHPNHGIDRER